MELTAPLLFIQFGGPGQGIGRSATEKVVKAFIDEHAGEFKEVAPQDVLQAGNGNAAEIAIGMEENEGTITVLQGLAFGSGMKLGTGPEVVMRTKDRKQTLRLLKEGSCWQVEIDMVKGPTMTMTGRLKALMQSLRYCDDVWQGSS